MLADHDERGFAFAPHERAPVDGGITYGDTSLTFRWLAENATCWRIETYEHCRDDQMQVIVYLLPA
jgi:hypothetical protein